MKILKNGNTIITSDGEVKIHDFECDMEGGTIADFQKYVILRAISILDKEFDSIKASEKIWR